MNRHALEVFAPLVAGGLLTQEEADNPMPKWVALAHMETSKLLRLPPAERPAALIAVMQNSKDWKLSWGFPDGTLSWLIAFPDTARPLVTVAIEEQAAAVVNSWLHPFVAYVKCCDVLWRQIRDLPGSSSQKATNYLDQCKTIIQAINFRVEQLLIVTSQESRADARASMIVAAKAGIQDRLGKTDRQQMRVYLSDLDPDALLWDTEAEMDLFLAAQIRAFLKHKAPAPPDHLAPIKALATSAVKRSLPSSEVLMSLKKLAEKIPYEHRPMDSTLLEIFKDAARAEIAARQASA